MAYSFTELGEYVKVQGGFAYKSKDFQETGGNPVLKIKNVRFGNVNYSETAYISDELAHQTKDWETREGDVLISMTGSGPNAPQSLVGRVARVWGNEPTAYINQRVGRIKLKKELDIDLDFLFYLLSMPKSQEFLVSNSSGSANQANISSKIIESLPCPVVEYEVSKKIAIILRSIDEKIRLNRQINATLEQMAQALFKSWFVDFDPVIDNALDTGNPIPAALAAKGEQRKQLREAVAKGEAEVPTLPDDIRSLFPSEFEFTEEMGWIPKGWSIQAIDELIQLTGGGTPKTTIDKYWNGDIPWFSVVDAPSETDVFVVDTEKHVTQAGIDNSSTKILRPGTTIISARGTVGKCALVAAPMTMNQSCYAVNGRGEYSDEFVYYLIRYQVSGLQQRSHGSVFSTITRDTFKSIRVPASNSKVTNKYSAVVKPLFDKILSNLRCSRELEMTRDTLLPKLISGELQIPEAEKLAAEALN